MVTSLLQATQLLSQDRTDLYNQVFAVIQGGRISNKQIAKKFALEDELMQVYNEIIEGVPDVAKDIASSQSSGIASLQSAAQEGDLYTQGHEVGLNQSISRHRRRALTQEALGDGGIILQPLSFVAYTLVIWVLGLCTCLLVNDYIVRSDYVYGGGSGSSGGFMDISIY